MCDVHDSCCFEASMLSMGVCKYLLLRISMRGLIQVYVDEDAVVKL